MKLLNISDGLRLDCESRTATCSFLVSLTRLIFLSFNINRWRVCERRRDLAMSCRRFFSIPVLSVILVMGLVYYITLFVFIDDWVGLRSSAGKLNALVFTSLASLCIFSLSICVLLDPGRVPSSYAPDVESSSWSGSHNVSSSVFDDLLVCLGS